MKRSNSIKIIFLLVVFSIIFSNFLVIGYSNVVGIPNGLKVEYIFDNSAVSGSFPASITFTYTSSDFIHIEMYLGGNIDETGSWDVNTSTRIISNVQNFGPSEGDHSSWWIYTDVILNDQIVISNLWLDAHTGSGDTIFNITGEAMHGSMEVWVLEDEFGSEVWYEKERGFLVNGTMIHVGDYQKSQFVSAGVPKPGISGYSLVLLISVISIVSIILIRKQNVKK